MERLIDLVSLIKVASIVEHETKVALHFHLLLFLFFSTLRKDSERSKKIFSRKSSKNFTQK